jgi:hypothetical protein
MRVKPATAMQSRARGLSSSQKRGAAETTSCPPKRPRLRPGSPGFPSNGANDSDGWRTPGLFPSGTLKPSASAISLSRSCTSTSGSSTSPTAYRIPCLRLDHLVRRLLRLRHGPKARYGWVANPYRDASRPLLPLERGHVRVIRQHQQRTHAAFQRPRE